MSLFRVWSERPVASKYRALFDGIAEVVDPGPLDNPLSTLPGAQAIIASARIRYNAALLDQVPMLRVIARTGIGIDNIALAEATARKVMICNTPDGPTVSTAEHAITLIMAAAKHVKRGERMLGDGRKHDFFSEHNGMELDGRQLGLIGLGRIGSHVAKVMKAVGMAVAVYDPFVSPERAAELGVSLMPNLEDVLRIADVVSIHAPLTPETRRLINAATLAQMKHGAYLINTARGGLVDEAALRAALLSGHLAGAGLDVLENEAEGVHPFADLPQVIATPHIAGASRGSIVAVAAQTCENIGHFVRGEPLQDLVPGTTAGRA